MTTAEQDTASASVEPVHYPWHNSVWDMLTRDPARLPHALLLYGQRGLGKKDLALRLAQFLLCGDRGRDAACGRCRGCLLFRAGNHPDLLRVSPLEDSKSILVDQVREVIEFVSFKPHSATCKIVLLSPAESMNVNAANGLLKVLEEPPAGTLLILVATHLSRLPMTIRSRCSRVAVGLPPEAEALQWLGGQSLRAADAQALLGQAGGAPLAALGLSAQGRRDTETTLAADLAALARKKADPVACAERWKSIGSDVCLDWWHRDVTRLIRTSVVGAVAQDKILSISIIDLFDLVDKVSIARRQLGTGADETLILESLLIRWCEITRTAD